MKNFDFFFEKISMSGAVSSFDNAFKANLKKNKNRTLFSTKSSRDTVAPKKEVDPSTIFGDKPILIPEAVAPITDEEKKDISSTKATTSEMNMSIMEMYNFSIESGDRDISFCLVDSSKIDPVLKEAREFVLQGMMDKKDFIKAVYRATKVQFSNITRSVLEDEIEKIYENVLFYRDLYMRLLQFSTCEMKPSKIHGNGLFATRKLKRGDVITFFFPYFLETIIENGLDGADREEGLSILPLISRRNLNASEIPEMRRCENSVSEKTLLMGDPKMSVDTRFLAHFINDPCIFTPGMTELDYEGQIVNSFNACIIRYNAEPRILYVTAYKNIEIGDEILIPYGWNYWSTFGNPAKEVAVDHMAATN